MEAGLRTKLVSCERPPGEEEEPVEEEVALEPPSGPQETHPTGDRRVTRQVTNAGDDPDQVLDQDSQLLNCGGQRPRVENETPPGDSTNESEDVDPEAKRRVTDMLVQVQSQVRGGIMHPPGLPLLHETSSALTIDSGRPGSVDQDDEDVSQLIPVLLAHWTDLNLKDHRWQTKEAKHLVEEGYRKEMESLVEDTKVWVLVSLE